ncbi:MAG: hypothetical protein J6T92_06520, partial [Ottowia sp.]|nr:hypothetical protein [Ottowia sp.]
MFNTRKLCAAAALALCAALPTAAMAAGKVLYLSTAEGYTALSSDSFKCPDKLPSGNNYEGSLVFMQNAITSFKNQVADPTNNFISHAGALSTDHQIARAAGKDSSRPDIDFETTAKWSAVEDLFIPGNLGSG